MGFFKKSVSAEPKRTALTIISRDNKISGDMTITGKLHVDGNIEGRISSIEDVSIGRTGFVKGYIKAKNITVSGLLEGEVHCDYLHILSGGRVVASVTSLELITDSHSQFIGERRESLISINDKSVEQAKIADEIELDIIDNLPNKITLDHSGKGNDSASDDLATDPDLQVSKAEELEADDQHLSESAEIQPEETNADNNEQKAEDDKHALDDLGVLSYMEGLEFLDELDAQCDMQNETLENEIELIEGKDRRTEEPLLGENHERPSISSIVRILPDEELVDNKAMNESDIQGDTEIAAQISEETDKIERNKRDSSNSKRIDENTTKLELKF